MRIKNYILIWLFLILYVTSFSQSNKKYFYYNRDEKIFLEPDFEKIAISSSEDIRTSTLSSSLSKKNMQISIFKEDNVRNSSIDIDQKATARKRTKSFYMEIKKVLSNTMSDYLKEINEYSKIDHVIKVSPCFKSVDGKSIGLSNNISVKLKSVSDLELLYQQADLLKLEVLGHYEFMPLWFSLSCSKETKLNALEAANKLYETNLFEVAKPQFIYHDLEKLGDPYFGYYQWGLNNTGQYNGNSGIDIRVLNAWNKTTGSPDIKVAIFDTGFEMTHRDLKDNVYGTGYDVTTNSSPSIIYDPHGTAVAGIVGARIGYGSVGVSPNSKLVSISMDVNTTTDQTIAAGFNWAWQNGVDIINCSWDRGSSSPEVNDAINNALTKGRNGKGIVIVSASGKSNNASIRHPAIDIPQIITVGAISQCGERKSGTSCDQAILNKTWGSSYGTRLDVMAPGVLICTTDLDNYEGYNTVTRLNSDNLILAEDYVFNFDGTSAAASFVSGVAALILSVNPNLAAEQVKDIIEKSSQKIRTDLYTYSTVPGRPNGTWNEQMGYGLIDADAAVSLASAATCPALLNVTSNVIAPNNDSKVAYTSVTANNIINSGASANYKAGKKIIMLPGFRAVSGANFRAYIEGGCNGTFAREATDSSDDVKYNYMYNLENNEKIGSKDITVFPNPSSGTINIQISFNESKKASFQILDVLGNKIYESAIKEIMKENYVIDLTEQTSGIYIIKLKTENLQEQVKFVLK